MDFWDSAIRIRLQGNSMDYLYSMVAAMVSYRTLIWYPMNRFCYEISFGAIYIYVFPHHVPYLKILCGWCFLMFPLKASFMIRVSIHEIGICRRDWGCRGCERKRRSCNSSGVICSPGARYIQELEARYSLGMNCDRNGFSIRFGMGEYNGMDWGVMGYICI